ncbi:MAG: tryptophan synthase subunit alpha [Cyclobacteriaceae bacterium]
MTRITQAFDQATKPLLNVYFTAGYPELESTISVLKSLEAAGTDLVELGMPYSDPLADGEMIQQSSSVALANGMSIEKLFEQLAVARTEISIPIILMGYLNPIMQFGAELFCEKCKEVGVDGRIIPDLPMELFDDEFQPIFDKHGLDFVFLITPETPEARIREIDKRSTGFIYMVSSSSTTGGTGGLTAAQLDYFQRIKEMKLQNRRMIGFGISDQKSFDQATEFAEGAIVGSAFIKQLGTDASSEAIKTFIQNIRP